MSLLFEGMNQKRFDIRLVERGLAKGSLHAPEIEKYLQSLPDETENADFVSLEELANNKAPVRRKQ